MAFRSKDYFDVRGLNANGVYTGYYEDLIVAERLMKKGRVAILENAIYTEMPTTTQKIFLYEVVGGGMCICGVGDLCFKHAERWWLDVPIIAGGLGLLLLGYKKRNIFSAGSVRKFV